MNETDILGQVRSLVDREHELRERRQKGELTQAEESQEMRQVEEALDQCWDLLRQRRAKSEFGEDPETTSARSTSVVENYLQ